MTMRIQFEAKDLHLVVSDPKTFEVALAYSISAVDAEIDAPLLLQLLKQFVSQADGPTN